MIQMPMNPVLPTALALLAAWLGLKAIAIVAATVRAMRAPVLPVRVLEPAPGTETPPLTAGQEAGLAELRGLGFAPLASARIEAGPRSFPWAFLCHAQRPAFATITFRAHPGAGYPVVFYSIDRDGRLLTTCNRAAWTRVASDPRNLVVDPYAPDLAGHWSAHEARLAQACTTDPEAALARIRRHIEGSFAQLQDAGAIAAADGRWHLRLRAALRTALAAARVQRALARPYVSAATGGEHAEEFFVACYEEAEHERAGQAERWSVKAGVLLLSLAASLLLFGLVLDWRLAAVLVGVLLVHECGHALAMRAFGWKDLSMFFVPFVGAMVTGMPKALPAWKHAVVLLAGPLPGLIGGVAIAMFLAPAPDAAGLSGGLGRDVALLAVGVNLFNLLPVTPLDGGRLLEIALFARWPRLRGAFAWVSVAAFAGLAQWAHSVTAWMIAGLLFLGLPSQWRAAILETAWKEDLPKEQQLRRLFSVLRERLRVAGIARQLALARAVYQHRLMRRPRLWESLATLALLVVVWGVPAAFAVRLWPHGGFGRHAEERSMAQRSFDEAWEAADAADGRSEALQTLRRLGQALAPDDPRQVDLLVAQAQEVEEPEHLRRIEAVLRSGRDGRRWTVDRIVRAELAAQVAAVVDRPAPERAGRMRAAIDWAERLAPGARAATVPARLRLAEAVDDGGDAPGARARLAQLRQLAETDADCRGELRGVLRAQAWFAVDHQAPGAAAALLEAGAASESAVPGTTGLALDYAWALLLSGRTDEGLARMRGAAYLPAFEPDLLQRLQGAQRRESRLAAPMDLAFALRRAGRGEEARALLAALPAWQCNAVRNGELRYEARDPWQRERDRFLRETADALCTR
jgi:Zn-dependent protease